ncbi:hypothetical protein MNBD_PLANCTO03-1971 [hydrothermal vent metagenome]|uniref:C-type lectin domain-containing protein n=1 Tax=hydrothermal vent metagenome TaxID=652676 RepID=A0A3B1DBZ6_9ZZZZ
MTSSRKIVLDLVLLAGTATATLGQTVSTMGPLYLGGEPKKAEVLRLAPAVLVDGEAMRVGEWVDPPSGAGRVVGDKVFDCFGDSNNDRFMDDSICGLGASRWYFGSGFCNLFISNDMVLHPETVIQAGAHAADIEWYWAVNGSGTSEQCVVGVFTQLSDPDACEPDSGAWGWLFDFGILPGREEYWANLDLPPGDIWDLPPDGSGSYVFTYLTDDGNSWATCAHSFMWGASNNEGADPLAPGEQGPNQLDDINPPYGSHTVLDECIDHTWDLCPDPLGAMIQFWGEVGEYDEPAAEWRVQSGGNGHWYDIEVVNPAADWFEAQQRAQDRGGYLATITSWGESSFLFTRFVVEGIEYQGSVYAGGYQQDGADEPNGGWTWVTGEPFLPPPYFWTCSQCNLNECEPNDAPDDADFLVFQTCSTSPNKVFLADGPAYWGDRSFVVEWDADCNSDGIVDYGQIVNGTLADTNDNGIPDICECVADFNNDGSVDTQDFLAFLNAWNAGESSADINGDGLVNSQDVLAFLNLWNAGC